MNDVSATEVFEPMNQSNDVFLAVPESAIDWRDPSGTDDGADGCPWSSCKKLLRKVGLRPTRQRLLLGWILFAKGNRHVTADMIYEEAVGAKLPVSLATVYNTLNQFTEVGLLREIGVAGPKSFFDTNPSAHHHFLVEGEEHVFDIPETEDVILERAPTPPEGFEVARVDVVVRLRRIPTEDAAFEIAAKPTITPEV